MGRRGARASRGADGRLAGADGRLAGADGGAGLGGGASTASAGALDVQGAAAAAPRRIIHRSVGAADLAAVARCQAQGISQVDIAAMMGLTDDKVNQIVSDARYPIYMRAAALDDYQVARVQADRRLRLAYEALDAALTDKQPWLRFQAAQFVIGIEERRNADSGRVEIVMSSEMMDALKVQDDAAEPAEQRCLEAQPACEDIIAGQAP